MSQGVVYGDYYLLGRLAMGGMAEVFLAKSLLESNGDADRLLALKRTLPQFSTQADFVSMFTDEARIAHRLRHPNICEIFDQGEANDQLYIVMEFIHGKDLKVTQHRASQRGEPVPARFVAYTLARIAQALDFAHHKTNDSGEPENIVHRDISPQNILISYDGVPKLIDFGIAKAKDRIAKTRVGIVKGKFAYMSPEQAIGAEVDWRTDIFAMGVVLYELCTNQLPFKGSSDFSTLKRIAKAEYIPAAQANPDIPARVAKIIEKCLAREREARYQRAADLAADLDRYLVDEGGRAVNETALSSYMRKLFRDDYIREMARIREFYAFAPPHTAMQRALHRRAEMTDPGDASPIEIDPDSPDIDADFEESTVVAATLDLAAGFDAEVTGLNDLLGRAQGGTDPDRDGLLPTTDPVPIPSEFEEKTREVGSVEHIIHQLKDEARVQSKPEVNIFEETTREVNPGDLLAKERRGAASVPRAAAASRAPIVDVDASFTEDTTDEVAVPAPSAGELPFEEPTELVDFPEDQQMTRAAPPPAALPVETTDTQPREPERESDEEVELSDLEVDEQSLPEAPPRGGWSDEKSDDDLRLPVGQLSAAERPPLFTQGEKKVLWIAGALGVCIVFGSYWVAAHGRPAWLGGEPAATFSAERPGG